MPNWKSDDAAITFTVTFTVEELLPGFGSLKEDMTVAVLLMTVPLAVESFTLATRVMLADAPGASVVNEMVWLLPVPAHVPPPVAEQETKVVVAGKLSVTTTASPVLAPLFVRVKV